MLYIIATPIGNLADLSPRAVEALRASDVLACEDTRRTRALLSSAGIPRPPAIVSYREQTEQKAAEKLIRMLEDGRTVSLCSDGGYPGISDPGYRLVSAAAERGLELSVIPGPSAVTVALLASGLPTSSYTFRGYPPRKPGPLRRFFEADQDRAHTLVLFESPYRVAATLAAAAATLGDRRAAVCIELTKRYERVERGFLGDLAARFDGQKVKGEVTLVIAGNHPRFVRQGHSPPSAEPESSGCAGPRGGV